MSFQDPDHQQRQSAAAAAKQAMLQKFRAASEDPEVVRRHAARVARTVLRRRTVAIAALSPRSEPFVETSNQNLNRRELRRRRATRLMRRACSPKVAPSARIYAILGE